MKYILINITITALIIWFINKLLFKKSKLTRVESRYSFLHDRKEKIIHIFSVLLVGLIQLMFILVKGGISFLSSLAIFLTILLLLRLVRDNE